MDKPLIKFCLAALTLISTPQLIAGKLMVDFPDGQLDLYMKTVTITLLESTQLTESLSSEEKTNQYIKSLAKSEANKIAFFRTGFETILLKENLKLSDFLIQQKWDNDTIEAIIRHNAPPVYTEFYKDGYVKQTFKLFLATFIKENHFPEVGSEATPEPKLEDITGIIINLPKDTPFEPALMFNINSTEGHRIYYPEKIDFSSFQQTGMAFYATAPLLFKNEASVGKKPIVINALPATTEGTIIISEEDHQLMLQKNPTLSFLRKGNVIIVYQSNE